jgi:outer membrane protein assembly factor BamB
VSGKFNTSQGSIRRLSAANGAAQWALDIEITDATEWPVLRSTGVIDVFARDAEFNPALLQIDTQSGAFTTTNFGFDFYSGPPNPAVGADGSLYLVHSENVGTVSAHTFFSRVRPDGFVSWTTPDLASVVATSPDTKLQSPSTLALGVADRVFSVVSTITSAGTGCIVLALDADSGARLWQSDFLGQPLGGPAVRPDGSVAILLGPLEASRLVILDGQSGTPTAHKLDFGGFGIHAITRSGNAIIATNEGKGATGLAAVDGDGKTQWTHAVPVRSATLGANGMLFVVGSTLLGLDSATGATRWELAPPNPESCLLDGALTSGSGIVAVQCDGTVFGAAD